MSYNYSQYLLVVEKVTLPVPCCVQLAPTVHSGSNLHRHSVVLLLVTQMSSDRFVLIILHYHAVYINANSLWTVGTVDGSINVVILNLQLSHLKVEQCLKDNRLCATSMLYVVIWQLNARCGNIVNIVSGSYNCQHYQWFKIVINFMYLTCKKIINPIILIFLFV